MKREPDAAFMTEAGMYVDDVMATLQELHDVTVSKETLDNGNMHVSASKANTDCSSHWLYIDGRSDIDQMYDHYSDYTNATTDPVGAMRPPGDQQHFMSKMSTSLQIDSQKPFTSESASFASFLELVHSATQGTAEHSQGSPNNCKCSPMKSAKNRTRSESATEGTTNDLHTQPQTNLQTRTSPDLSLGKYSLSTGDTGSVKSGASDVTWSASTKSLLDLDGQQSDNTENNCFDPFSTKPSDFSNTDSPKKRVDFQFTDSGDCSLQPYMDGVYHEENAESGYIYQNNNHQDYHYSDDLATASSARLWNLTSPSYPPSYETYSSDVTPFLWSSSPFMIKNLSLGCGGMTTALMPTAITHSTGDLCGQLAGFSAGLDNTCNFPSERYWEHNGVACDGCITGGHSRGYDVTTEDPTDQGLQGQYPLSIVKVGTRVDLRSLEGDSARPTRIPTSEGSDESCLSVEDVADAEDELFLAEMLSKDPPKPSRKSKRGCRLWEFIRDLLLDTSTNPSIIRWENREAGTFRLVKSKAIARIWGLKKGNEAMNYEKLSRAMRYYYKRQVFQPVIGKRLVYSFGPRATGWRD